ncbi:MAG: hypothetical protein AB7S54_10715 [Bacteroidales bacterium]
MKKLIKRVLIILVIILIIPIFLYVIWSFQPRHKLNIYILDKTVLRTDRPEHKAFVWILNQNRYVGPDGKPYSASRDYWGFFPIDLSKELFDFKAIRLNEVDAYAAVYDAAYYADCYGVYAFEWYKNIAKPVQSSKVYGGLNQNDYFLLKKMKEAHKLIIGEYNMFSTPTNALIRSKAEELFNIMWTGWAGKVFLTLDTGQPGGPADWMPKLYESQHLQPWPTQNQGIVLVSNDGLIDVLVLNESLKSLFPKIVVTPDNQKQYGLPEETLYPCWFEFVAPGTSASVHATFNLDVTDAGAGQLAKLGLNTQFPAVIQAGENEPTYYFAGDFAQDPVISATSKLAGGKFLNHFFSPKNNRTVFFNTFYTPLIENIFYRYYQQSGK